MPRTNIRSIVTRGAARRADPPGPESDLDPLEDLVRDVEVGPDILHVVVLLEELAEPEDALFRRLVLDLDTRGRHHLDVGLVDRDRGALEGGAQLLEVGGR